MKSAPLFAFLFAFVFGCSTPSSSPSPPPVPHPSPAVAQIRRPHHRPYRAVSPRIGPQAVVADPISWSTPQWEIDGQNVSGCASDKNNCTSATCAAGNVGPCATVKQVASRLGPNPAPSIDVIFDFLSDTAAGDAFNIVFNGPGFYTLQGQLHTVTTGVVGAVNPRSRGSITGTNLTVGHPWQITAQGAAPSFWTSLVGDLVHDTTTDGWAWVHADLGNAQASWTEPMTELRPDGAEPSPPIYKSPSPGDAFTVYTLPQVAVVQMGGVGFSAPYVYHVSVTNTDQEGGGFGEVLMHGDAAGLLESRTSSTMSWANSQSEFFEVNCSDDAVFWGTLGATVSLIGGEIRDIPSEVLFSTYSSLDGDILVGPRIHVIQNGMLFLGRACIENQIDGDRTTPNLLYVTGQIEYGDAYVWTDAAAGGAGGVVFLSRGSRLFMQINNVPNLTFTNNYLVPTVIDNNNFLYPWNVRNSGTYGAGLHINGNFGGGIVSTQVDAVAQDAGVNNFTGVCLQGDLLSAICYQ